MQLSRTDLDSRSSESYSDPWDELASEFNDYTRNKYLNACIKYDPISGMKLTPYQALPSVGAIAKTCYDLNPSDSNRPIRDGSWVRDTWKNIRTELTKAGANFWRSGHQDLEQRYDSWVAYTSAQNDQIVTYAVAALPWDLLKNLGKLLPQKLQRDTGILQLGETFYSLNTSSDSPAQTEPAIEATKQRDYSQTPGAVKKRKLREQRRDRGSSESSLTVDDSEESIAAVLKEAAQQDLKFNALTQIVKLGDENEKAEAMKKLKELAGL